MRYYQKGSQVSYGEAIGILLLDSPVPFIPGDVANATTYDFPVRFKKVVGLTVEKALGKDDTVYPAFLKAAMDLKAHGVRAVTGDCGFMALHQKRLKEDLEIPVFLSSLFQIPFIRHIIPDKAEIGIITASARSLTPMFLKDIGIHETSRLVVKGLENCPEFSSAVLEEKGSLDSDLIEAEVVKAAVEMTDKEKNIKAILLECSVLPPYARAIQNATQLPVFDYITMINYVFRAVVQTNYTGFM